MEIDEVFREISGRKGVKF